MSWTPSNFDIIVVGVGPIGLTAAALLSSAGASVLLLERNAGTSNAPKAISIDDESLRTFAAADLDRRILSLIVPGTGTAYYDASGEKVFQAGSEIPFRFGYPFKNPFAQPELELFLLDALLERDNVEVRFGATVTGLRSSNEGVLVDYDSDGASHSIVARFVLGADGARSTVRTQLGIKLSGRSYTDDWLVIDTLRDPHRERYGMHHGDPARPHVIVPGLDARCRYEFQIFEGEGEAGETPSFELIERVVAPYRTIEPEDVERAVIYRFNGVVADDFSKGSAFLLGDAAHQMPPFAGQGLNSGIRDAANLCWKLHAVLRGEAPDSILASYGTERRDHCLATVRLSEKLGRVVMTTSPRVAKVRDEAVRRALTTKEGREYFEYMKYRPSAKFTEGLVLSGTHPRVGTQIGQPRVFSTQTRRMTLLDEALGRGWSILQVTEGELLRHPLVDTFARTHNIPAFDLPLSDVLPLATDGQTALIDLDAGIFREFVAFSGCFVLIRPDHVVAAAWHPAETKQVLGEICRWWN